MNHSTSQPDSRKTVLFVTHNIAAHGLFGGAELYLEKALLHLTSVERWVFVPDRRSKPILNYLLYGPNGRVVEKFTLKTPVNTGDLLHPELEDIFQSITNRYNFDIIHFNHILWFSFSLPLLAKASGAKTLYSLHDYYPVCENFTLLDADGTYCNIPSRPLSVCDPCLARMRNLPAGSQARRLAFLRHAFDSFDAVLVGSQASIDIFTAFFAHLGQRIRILPPPMILSGQRGRPIGSDERLHVALIGNFTHIKGGRTALELFRRCSDKALVFHVFGRTDPRYDRMFEALSQQNVIRHGPYVGSKIPPDLNDCDVALFLSICPETYCISLSEAQSLGIVPVVTDLGGQAERVRNEIDGIKVPVGDVEAAIAALERLQDRVWLRQLAASLPQDPGLDAIRFAARLDAIYAELLVEDKNLKPSYPLSLAELGVDLSQPRWSEP